MEYLATFENHTQAMRYALALNKKGIRASMMPRPRILEASCGTAVRFWTQLPPDALKRIASVQRLYRITESGYLPIG